MYTTVVVPLDADKAAHSTLGPAISLTQDHDAEVVLVGTQDLVERVEPTFAATCAAVGRRYLGSHEAPTEVIADIASQRGEEATLVVTPTRAHGRLGYVLSGSTSEDIVRSTRAGVMLIGPDCRPDWRPGGPVALCLDGSDLAEQAIPAARQWALDHNSDVVLIRVADPGPTFGIPRRAASPDDRWSEPAGSYLDRRADLLRIHGVTTDCAVLPGRWPADAIVAHLRAQGFNLVVAATHGRSGLGRVVLGSTTVALARHSPCPVLTATPSTGDAAPPAQQHPARRKFGVSKSRRNLA